MKSLIVAAVAGVGASLALLAQTVFAGGTVTITPGNMQDWAFYQEGPTGVGSFTTGPGTVPMGNGSAQLSVNSTGREILATARYAGKPLSEIEQLQYSTYRLVGNDPLAISLQLDVDYDLTDTNTAWQGRLVYEPYMSGTVSADTWQTWDAKAGNWWSSGAPGNTVCPQSNPCTMEEVLTAFPNAGIRAEVGLLNLRAGGPWTGGFTGNVDKLVFNDNIFDFEFSEPAPTPSPTPSPTVSPTPTPSPTPSPCLSTANGPCVSPVPSPKAVPTTADQCKKDGYKTLVTKTGEAFKNQGQCVSYVNTQKSN